ncbi:hypothetical protein LCGC14_1447100 [marine sediment metagenome]|uniref:Uncharacterized protein n=1 Tax=marine sediment metagenome TaxID=412755 RepID=A0A0F9JIW9_9ZZZZ
MSEKYIQPSELLDQFHRELGKPADSQARQAVAISDVDYWIARALLEIASQLDGIRFELSGSKG